MLCAVTTIGYVDRNALAVAAPLIRREFGLSNEQYGQIGLAFLLAYALGQLLLGPVIDRLGSKRSLHLAVLWWSLASMLHAFGRGVTSFFAARAFLGLTEAANFPGAFKVIAEWFPPRERSLASGFVTAGTGLGAILAPPLIATLIAGFDALHARGLSPLHGWQAAFVVPGALGLAWILVWQRHFHLPQEDPAITPQELALVMAGRETGSGGSPGPWRAELSTYFRRLGYWFRYREVWGLALARFLGDGAFYFFAFWIPNYLSDVRHFGLREIAIGAAIPFVFADLGSLTGGWLGQRLIRGGMSVDRSRKLMIWGGALLVPLALPAAWVDSPALAVLCMGLGIFAIQVKSASMFALPADLVPARAVATVWGASGALGSLAAAFSQPVIGWTIDHFSYQPVFVAVSLMHVAAATVIMLFIPRIGPLQLRAGPIP
jgi:ACS family hexuronate transporter-like MFS transporter